MVERNRLQKVAGILEIIAGAFWAYNLSLVNQVASIFGLSSNQWLLLLPMAVILEGVFSCVQKRKISDFITLGSLDFIVVVVEFCFEVFSDKVFVGLGIAAMILLLVSAQLYFLAVKSHFEKTKEEKRQTRETVNTQTVSPQKHQSTEDDIYTKLMHLEKLFNTGIITEQEYKSERIKLIQKMFD